MTLIILINFLTFGHRWWCYSRQNSSIFTLSKK